MKKLIPAFLLLFTLMFFGEITFSQNIGVMAEEEKGSKYEVSIAPNPFDNEATITINGGNKKVTHIRIHDIIGKEVAYIDLRNKSGQLSFKLDFSNLPAGVYFCNVYGEEGIIETKRLSHTK